MTFTVSVIYVKYSENIEQRKAAYFLYVKYMQKHRKVRNKGRQQPLRYVYYIEIYAKYSEMCEGKAVNDFHVYAHYSEKGVIFIVGR